MRIATENDLAEKNTARLGSRQIVKERLEAERREISAELDSEFQPGEELAVGWQERDSPAERELREVEFSHREALLVRLRQISDAIERIELGDYGLCSGCGRKIGKKRLQSDPAVALCLGCQERAENLLES